MTETQTRTKTNTGDDYRRFIREFLRRPNRIGAVAPSSNALSLQLVKSIDWDRVQCVLEYGPGTGVMTRHILNHMRPGTRFHAIELNPDFAAIVRQRFPQVVVHEDTVANVKTLCEREGLPQIDAILSGLPWASFSNQDQRTYLDAMMTVLKPGGQFATFGYLQGLLLPAGRRFRQQLGDYFADIRKSRIVWGNIPPAFHYSCRRAG